MASSKECELRKNRRAFDGVIRLVASRFYVCLILSLLSVPTFGQDFLEDQLRYERVRTASEKHDRVLAEMCREKGLNYPPNNIYLRIFKFDKLLEVWGSDHGRYVKIKDYEICQLSGDLGPKRQQGDGQIPEGLYEISKFNPTSQYHLSLKVNYPNEADRLNGTAFNLGGDIFIHGDCVTIGCVPILDEPMEELYWLAARTYGEGGHEIPVHIFPFIPDPDSWRYFRMLRIFDQSLWDFWSELKPIYDLFEQTRTLPQYQISESGKYVLQD